MLEEFKVPEKLIALITMTLKNTRAAVAIGGKLTEDFQVIGGLRPGNLLSTLEFAHEKMMRDSEINVNVRFSIERTSTSLLQMRRGKSGIENYHGKINNESEIFVLCVDEEKSKFRGTNKEEK
ncbi:hypothetical protein HHI36_010506 [Cryptolaemus montrouzieri]|uniref:Uncharacterized protein n=1 Tax=Cryptolaemus montrouzieri TaxID=559131 RepID=A0ABD2MIZ9_9CUCU